MYNTHVVVLLLSDCCLFRHYTSYSFNTPVGFICVNLGVFLQLLSVIGSEIKVSQIFLFSFFSIPIFGCGAAV